MKRDVVAATRRPSKGSATPTPGATEAADAPALRLFALLERIAARDGLFSLQSLVEDSGWPKPTVHRMLQQLESAGLVRRDGDARHYGTGLRLRRFAENVLTHSTLHAARHRVLRALVDEIGESCNITAFAGGEVVYLDRVETAAPLRFYLQPGSRVPAHASASGKVFLAQMPAAARDRLLGAAPLERYTPHTLTDRAAFDAELAAVRRDGMGLDREEFLPGLVCVAVPVPPAAGQSRPALCVALQAPTLRLSIDRAQQWLPSLQRAAAALGRIEQETPADPEPPPTRAPKTPTKTPAKPLTTSRATGRPPR